MTHTIAAVLLGICLVGGLIMIPLGLPGLWVMVGGVIAYAALTQTPAIGVATLLIVLGLAFLGEIFEWWIGFGVAKRYGGSRRAGWGALLGGIAGAIVGVPVPIIGSVIGAFLGSFVGAAVFEYASSGAAGTAVRAGWGAVLGRAFAAAAKCALGVVIAVIGTVAALRG